jgi:hypothetical protein
VNETFDTVPVGAIVPTGTVLAATDTSYIPCDGRSLSKDDYGNLFDVIGYTYGGEAGKKTFCVPDCRGRFLRGADRDAKVDPDSKDRNFVGPDPKPKVGFPGSYQDYATMRPTRDLASKISHLPKGTLCTHGITTGGHAEVKGDKIIETCTDGGDGDTRPPNVYVEFYIKARP